MDLKQSAAVAETVEKWFHGLIDRYDPQLVITIAEASMSIDSQMMASASFDMYGDEMSLIRIRRETVMILLAAFKTGTSLRKEPHVAIT